MEPGHAINRFAFNAQLAGVGAPLGAGGSRARIDTVWPCSAAGDRLASKDSDVLGGPRCACVVEFICERLAITQISGVNFVRRWHIHFPFIIYYFINTFQI